MRDLHVEQVLRRTRDGGSCAACGSDYRGAPYSEGRGVRVLGTVEPGVTEPLNLCPDCAPERVRIEDVKLSEEEIEAIRPYAAYLDLTLEEAVSVLAEAGLREMMADRGLDTEDADPETMGKVLLEEYEVSNGV